jgi:diguanylate cyclase (GGDEF)-like protein
MATILIIDDQKASREPVVALLGRHDHLPLVALDGEEALEIVRVNKPDMVLADVLMPDMDGYQFLVRLRAEPNGARLPVVFRASAHVEIEARELMRDCGISHFISKSAEPEMLLAAIRTALPGPASRPVAPRLTAGSAAARLHTLAFRFQQRMAQLESFNAELNRRMSDYAAQLMAARSALEQEVTKRIWAEKELTEANRLLHDKAVRDALTGLYNRRYLEESLDREVSRARRSGLPVGVMMIDIDHFKLFNDAYGHAAGDAVLRAVSKYVLSLTRGEDILCRYGGEEFVLVMAHASPRAVWERAEALREGVQGLKVEHGDRQIGPVAVSIGIAMLPDQGESGQTVLHAADAALYEAKRAGRNRVVLGDKVQA